MNQRKRYSVTGGINLQGTPSFSGRNHNEGSLKGGGKLSLK